MSKPPRIFGTLLTEIVRTDLCMYCGACIASCPVNVIARTDDEKPTLAGICILCELCYYGCPRVQLPLDQIEENIFGRTRQTDEPYGIKLGVFSARSTDPEVRKRVQDGGVATTILRQALERKIVDRVITVGTVPGNPWKPVPVVVSDGKDLLEHAHSKYTSTGSLSGLADAAAGYPDSDFAFVGVPCQLQALRRLATSPHGARKLAERVKLALGLFCFNSYKYNSLFTDYLETQQRLDLSKISKVDCKAGQFTFHERDKTILQVPAKDLEPYKNPGCAKCQDFTGELSDISIGSVGSDSGWCTVITRKPETEQLLKAAVDSGALELRPDGPRVQEVAKLSEAKRKRPAPYIPH